MNTKLIALCLCLGGVFASPGSGVSAQDAPPGPRQGAAMDKVAYILQKALRQPLGKFSTEQVGRAPTSSGLVPIRDDQMVKLVVHAMGPLSPAEKADLLALGAEIEAEIDLPVELGLPPVGQVQVWLPIDQLAALATLAWVVAVTPVDPVVTHKVGSGRIVSEGVEILRARGPQRRGITGRGITVGVMSNGVDSLARAQARKELPRAVEVLDPGQGDEGTAMLEIVHDMAPGADLVFVSGGEGVPGYVDGLIALSGVADIITEDLGLPLEPKFQQGVAAAVADALAGNGTGVYSAPGNYGLSHVRNVVAVGSGRGPDDFEGPFVGCTVPPLNTVEFRKGDNTVDVEFVGNGNPIVLQWSEPRAIFPTANAGGFTNLDLYLLDETGTTCLDESLGVQADGRGDPIEFIAAPMDTSRAKVVVNVRGVSSPDTPPPMIDLNLFESAEILDRRMIARSGSSDADSNYVGEASNVAARDATTRELQDYSSGGPILLGLTTDIADDLSPVVGSGVERLAAPSFTAVDGNSISGVGGFGEGTCPGRRDGDCRFFGTSASAPHAAGCAALVREARGLSDTADVRAALIATAKDIEHEGTDFTSGAGLLRCGAATRTP